MPRTRPSRTTHEHDGELVVFLIGMRLNQPWRIDPVGSRLHGHAEDAG